LTAYYFASISSLYRCIATVFYRRTATLFWCTAANIVISKAILSPILSLVVLSSPLNAPYSIK